MDLHTQKKLSELLKKIDDFRRDIKPLRNALSRHIGRDKANRNKK